MFGIGFAPRSGEALLEHLRQKGSATTSWSPPVWSPATTEARTTGSAAGCCGRSGSCRAMSSASAPGGSSTTTASRRSTSTPPRRPIYKKSQLLYGVDLARKEIARSSQAVVVEGYTDVMACHLAGVTTAVATCGTAFGEDHTRILRRLLLDHDEFRGEVIFTFDGDEAGQKAALRAFERRPAVRRPDLRRGRARRPRPVRAADRRGRRRGPRADRPAGPAVPVRARQRHLALRPRPGRQPGRRDPRGRQAGRQHPRQVQGRRVRPRAGRHGRRFDDRARSGPRYVAPGRRAGSRPAVRWREEPPAAARATCPTRRAALLDRARRAQARAPAPGHAIDRRGSDLEADDFTHPYYRGLYDRSVLRRARARRPPEAVCRDRHRCRRQGLVSALSVEQLHVTGSPDAAAGERRTSSGCASSPRCAGSSRSSPSCSG